jgi:hypothetical protein
MRPVFGGSVTSGHKLSAAAAGRVAKDISDSVDLELPLDYGSQ